MMPPPQEEEKNPLPAGYTRVMSGAQQPQGASRVLSLGRPSAIERGGGPGQFVPSGYKVQPFGAQQGIRLGEIPVANAPAVRQPTLGQATTTPIGTEPAPPPLPSNGNNGGAFLPTQAAQSAYRRRAWGRLKKRDASELAEYLAEIENRMDAANIPAGIVRQIREKLDTFAASAEPEEAEIEISDTEAAALDVAILNLEQVEQNQTPSFATTAAVVAGLGIIVALAVG